MFSVVPTVEATLAKHKSVNVPAVMTQLGPKHFVSEEGSHFITADIFYVGLFKEMCYIWSRFQIPTH